MKVLCERLHRLSSDDLEEAARCNLAFLGKVERPDLTALEEKLLAVLEAQYICYSTQIMTTIDKSI